MRAAISQPRYLPAINYLYRIHVSDVFVLLDTCQHQSRGIENRNKLLLGGQPRWLTIPLGGGRNQISELSMPADRSWMDKHIKSVYASYGKAPHFDGELATEYYRAIGKSDSYVDSMQSALEVVLRFLFGETVTTRILKASEIVPPAVGSAHLAEICSALGANSYLSGANGRDYLDPEHFSGIAVGFHDFEWTPYSQVGASDFVPWMGMFDTIFNIGPERTVEAMIEGSSIDWRD